jgi:hypothetical protein
MGTGVKIASEIAVTSQWKSILAATESGLFKRHELVAL